MTDSFPGRVGLQQRVLPAYRVPFFDMLAEACEGGLSVFAGEPRRDEAILTGEPLMARFAPAHNRHLLRKPLYLCEQPNITDWLEDWDPDVLIMEANPRYLSTPTAIRWMRRRGRPVIGWGLGAPPFHGLLKLPLVAARRRFLRQFDALIAYSRRGAEEYRIAGVDHHRVFVAPNAVAPRPKARPDHPLHAGPINVVFVGRLQDRKRVDLLIRACSEMEKPQPKLVIVGDGPEIDHLEHLARQVYPGAQFAGARLGDELRPFLLKADLFVLPGTGGLAIQEAMAHALPVIVARGDGTQDDLVRDGNGWQIPTDDYNALVRTLGTAIAAPDRLRKMGQESFKIISEEVNLENMVAGFVTAMKSLTTGHDRDYQP